MKNLGEGQATMECPKCGFENPTDRADCLRCRVIFAKIHQGPVQGLAPQVPVPLAEAADERETARESVGTWNKLLFSNPGYADDWGLWGRMAVLLVLAIWGGKLMFSGLAGNAAGESWLHLINLPFHEAGHLFFRPLGSFMTSLGGTLGQLLVPLLCMGVLLVKTRDPFGGAVCLWWFGENFLDIAPYINDARAGVLPLVGGNFGHSSPYGFHDWEYLLTESGLLRYDHALAKFSHCLGSLLMILAVVWAGVILLGGSKQEAD
jgi:hypothetical protein